MKCGGTVNYPLKVELRCEEMYGAVSPPLSFRDASNANRWLSDERRISFWGLSLRALAVQYAFA